MQLIKLYYTLNYELSVSNSQQDCCSIRLADKEMFLLEKLLIETPTLQVFDYVKLNCFLSQPIRTEANSRHLQFLEQISNFI